MAEISWKDAIIAVLKEAGEPLHYQEVTERILSSGLKKTAGATPAATVNAQIASSIKHDGAASPFIRIAKGTFTLRSDITGSQQLEKEAEDDSSSDDNIVRAFGMYWQRDLVVWKQQPSLHGRQQVGAIETRKLD